MNILRTVGNRIVGRKKNLDEKFDGLDDVHSLLKKTPETLFEIKYTDMVKTYKEEHVYPESVVSSINGFMQLHPGTTVDCKHTVFSGKDFDNHYVEIKSQTSYNMKMSINYFTVKQ